MWPCASSQDCMPSHGHTEGLALTSLEGHNTPEYSAWQCSVPWTKTELVSMTPCSRRGEGLAFLSSVLFSSIQWFEHCPLCAPSLTEEEDQFAKETGRDHTQSPKKLSQGTASPFGPLMAFETHLIVAEEVTELAKHLLCRDEGPSSDVSISVKAGPDRVPVSPMPGREAEAGDFLTSQPS